MTDTGQVPSEGLPQDAGTVEQPGTPASGVHTFIAPAETATDDDDQLLMPGAQGAWTEGQPGPSAAAQPTPQPAPEPGPHETAGRDSGSIDLGAVRVPGPSPAPDASSDHAVPPQSGPARRPLHLGPPVPGAMAGPVRSLADRGPAAGPAPAAPSVGPAGPVRGPSTTGPEYLDVPGPQPGETPPQGAAPWAPQSPVSTAETVVPSATDATPSPEPSAPVGQFVPVDGQIPVTPHLAPTPPHAMTVTPTVDAPPATDGQPVTSSAYTQPGVAPGNSAQAASGGAAQPAAVAGPNAQAATAPDTAPRTVTSPDTAGQPTAAQGADERTAPAPGTDGQPDEQSPVDAAQAAAQSPNGEPQAAASAGAGVQSASVPGADAQAVAAPGVVAQPVGVPEGDGQAVGALGADGQVVPVPGVDAQAVAAPGVVAQPVGAPEGDGGSVAVSGGEPQAAASAGVGAQSASVPGADAQAVTAPSVVAQPVGAPEGDGGSVAVSGGEPQAAASAGAGVQAAVLPGADGQAAMSGADAQATAVAGADGQAAVVPAAPAGQVAAEPGTDAHSAAAQSADVPVAPVPGADGQADGESAAVPGDAAQAAAAPDADAQSADGLGTARPGSDRQPDATPATDDQAAVLPVRDGQPTAAHGAGGQATAPSSAPDADTRPAMPDANAQEAAALPSDSEATTAAAPPAPPAPHATPESALNPTAVEATSTDEGQTAPLPADEAREPAAAAGGSGPEGPESPEPSGALATSEAPKPPQSPQSPQSPETPGALETLEPQEGPEFLEPQEPQGTWELQGAQQPPQPQEPTAAPAPAPGYDDAERAAVLRVMRERRDIRNGFRSDPIPHEVLLRVLEAAHTAPSVGHSQPWDFVVIRSADTRRAMHELATRQREAYAKSLPKGRAKQFKELKIEAILDTPVNIVVTADPTRGGRHTLGRHTQPQMAPYSSALAVENLWLAARAEGLGVGWVSFFDEREMVRELGLPDHLEVVAYLCVGYVDEFPDEPELMSAGWSKRRPLSWVVHEETYGRRALPGEEPHDLLAETVAGIRPLDAKALGEAWERQKRMTKPAGALGMLEIISAQLSGLSRMCPPPIPEPAAVAIFAGDHGVHAQGVTPWPQEVTGQMVANFLGGGAVCNAFANQVGAEVCVIDVGVASDLPATPGLLPRKVRAGTADMTTGPALTREEVKAAVEVGIDTARDLVAAGNKALLTGEMGIANTTASAALISVFTGADPAEVTGRGTGINDETLARKTDVVRRALELHQPDPADPIGVLAAVGGLEHAAIVGLLLGGASLRTPVILDGVSAGAAALVARAIAPEALAACVAGHRSAEPGHVAALNKLGLRPLVDLDLRLGEGTGALLALPVVQSAARAMHEVATFDSAGVTEK
ncbi:nicotinate-nucleotide--dimethylbenzimidazole phosphoribosyltransferase [Streptomyces sp. O3]